MAFICVLRRDRHTAGQSRSFARLAAIVTAVGTLALASAAWGAGYQIVGGAINSGGGAMGSASHAMSSALGDSAVGTSSAGNFQAITARAPAIIVVPATCILDLDGNGAIDALTDGLLAIRAMFGLTGTAVTNGAVGAGATRTTWDVIQPMINLQVLDVDGDGRTDALTDGLIILRAAFGLTGKAVTVGALGSQAQRTDWNAIRSYLNATCGTSFGP